MIIRFSVSNFRSYKSETSLLLTSSSKIRDKLDHIKEIGKKLNVLRFSCLYGDNASGKTNILLGIEFLSKFVANSSRPNYDSLAYKGQENMPTDLDIVFSIGESVYQYGFSLIRKNKDGFRTFVLDEHLDLISAPGRRRNWIYRSKEGINFSFFSDEKKLNEIKFILEQYENSNAYGDQILFLTFLNKKDNVLKDSSTYDFFKLIYLYLSNNIVAIGSNTSSIQAMDKFKIEKIKRYVLDFDSGLEDIQIQDVSEAEANNILNKEILENISYLLSKRYAKTLSISTNNRNFLFVTLNEFGKLEFKRLVFKHKYIDSFFKFEEESEGTRRFVTLMSYFANDSKDLTFCIDEVERSMHPDAVKYLYSFCLEQSQKNNAQFIFSSHDTVFMKTYLRRDEIYFVDKDMYARSIIYPLTDFATRTDSNLVKAFEDGYFRKVSDKKEYKYYKLGGF